MADRTTSLDDLYVVGRQAQQNKSEELFFQEFQATVGSDLESTEIAEAAEEEPSPFPDPEPRLDVTGELPEYIDNSQEGLYIRTDPKWRGYTYIGDESKLSVIEDAKIGLNNDMIRMKNLGIGGIFNSIISPFSAFGNAVLAPFTTLNEDPGNVLSTFQASGSAFASSLGFQDSLNPNTQIDFGAEASEALFGPIENPIASEVVRTLTATLSDPAIVMGTSAMKVMERSLKTSALGKAEVSPFRAGLEEILGFSRVPDRQQAQMLRLATKADAGDVSSINKLSELLNDTEVNKAIATVEEREAREFLTQIVGPQGGESVSMIKPATTPESITTNLNSSEVKINLNSYNSPEELEQLVQGLTNFYKDEYKTLLPKVTTKNLQEDAQLVQLSDLIGKPVSNLELDEAYALRQALLSSSQLARDTIKAYKLDPSRSDQGFVAVTKALTLVKAINAKTRSLETHAGRLLNIQRANAEPSRETIEELRGFIDDLRTDPTLSEDNLDLLAQLTPEELSRTGKDLFKPNMADYGHEIFTNAILSGPQTHAINIVSNASNLILRPTQKVLEGMSAASRLDFQKANVDFKQSKEMMAALLGSVKDVVGIISRTTDRTEVLPEHLINSHEIAASHYRPKITAENIGTEGTLGSFIDIMGNSVRFFGNSLVTQDHIFKMINYRMSLQAEAVARASRKTADPEEYAMLKQHYINVPDVEDIRQAVDTAEYYTFTNQLGEAGTATKVWVKRTPGMRWILPFVQTPTNIVKFGVRHSTLGNVYKDVLPAIKGTGAEKDLARAKLAIGTMMPLAFMEAMGDNITGSVDQATPEGRFAAQNGRPPYSIKFGDQWVSYEKIEPFRTIVGLMVDYKTAINNLDPETDEALITEWTAVAVAPFLAVTTDNWMLPQLGDTIRILDASKEGNTENALKKFEQISASMMVPNLFNQSNRMFDKTLRDADTFVEKLKARTPGLSSDIPPYRNLWGEEMTIPSGLGPDIVSPFPVRDNADKTAQEILRLSDAGDLVDLPGLRRKIYGIQLNNVQISRFSEIRGQGLEARGMPPLKDAISEVINTEVYKNGSDALKGKMITYQINTYSNVARDILISEDEELRNKIISERQKQVEALIQ